MGLAFLGLVFLAVGDLAEGGQRLVFGYPGLDTGSNLAELTAAPQKLYAAGPPAQPAWVADIPSANRLSDYWLSMPKAMPSAGSRLEKPQLPGRRLRRGGVPVLTTPIAPLSVGKVKSGPPVSNPRCSVVQSEPGQVRGYIVPNFLSNTRDRGFESRAPGRQSSRFRLTG